MGRVVSKEAIFKQIGYTPHRRQWLFHNSAARFKVPVCGRRFGKSRMAAAEAEPELFKPNTVGWIVGPTYKLGAKEFQYMWDDIVIKLGMGPHIKRKANNVRTGEMFIEMPWGSRVDVMSAEYPDGLVGEGLDWIIVAEAAKQRPAVWDKYLRPSLADKKGWAVFPSTPEGFNWYHQLYLFGQDPEEFEWESWNFPSWENPYVYPGGFKDPEIQSQLKIRGENDPYFWQEIGADFRSFVGKIYPEWRDQVHIVDNYVYNPAWPNYTLFDFGFAAPFVCLDMQVSPSDECYVWREHYIREKALSEHIAMLRARTNPVGYNITCGFGDSADPGAVEDISTNYCPVFADSDAKDWVRGIQEVRKFLLPRGDPPKPHLFVSRACENTIWEFRNYRTKPPGKTEENPREDPKKWADHAMDAIRYGLMHLFVLGARHHLSDVYVPYNEQAPVGESGIFTWEGIGTTMGGKAW